MSYKFNALTGKLDLVSVDPANFSFNYVEASATITVPQYQQMLVCNSITVDGILDVEGEVVILDFDHPNRLVETTISESINIELYEVIRQTVSGITTSISNAVEGSEITITNRSGANNVLNLTVQGQVSPIIKDYESFGLVYNGVDYDLV